MLRVHHPILKIPYLLNVRQANNAGVSSQNFIVTLVAKKAQLNRQQTLSAKDVPPLPLLPRPPIPPALS